jgi:hypothetical protein
MAAFACLGIRRRRRLPLGRKWRKNGIAVMKRSRRVVLKLMGSAAVGAVSMGLVPRTDCGPGGTAVPGLGGKPGCRPVYGGFGGTPRRFNARGDVEFDPSYGGS